jgi:hypothetical protein
MRLLASLSLAVVFIAGISHAAPASSMKVAGLSQQELTVRWWQWAASFDYPVSPVSDMTGERCAAGQEGEVWFLAGTYSSSATRRTCRVPAGKYLFFPLINYVVMPSNCSGCLNCEQATASAREITDDVMGLFAELDGNALPALEEHRVASAACFDLAARSHSPVKIEPTASNGYWLLLPPLAKGRHTLRFGGALPSLRQELIYTLTVE